MKRAERQPLPAEIVKAIASDEVGRNRDIDRFLRLLVDIEGPFTILIDSPWGDGKTFFVKSAMMAMQSANPQIAEFDPGWESALAQFGQALQGIPFLPFYYNAWQNDSFGNPIATLLASMADEFGRQYAKDTKPFREKVSALIDVASGAFGHPLNVAGLAETFSGESLIQTYEARRRLSEGLNSLVRGSLPEVADKMVVFLDELDRCRPDFAVKLLEQTKGLFDCDNVILVISTDLLQLSYSIQGMYGERFDSLVYLERFYDYKFKLSPVDGAKFLEKVSLVDQHFRFDSVVNDIAKSLNLTMRDCNRLIKIREARQFIADNGSGNAASFAMQTCVLPILIILERDDPALWSAIRSGSNIDAVYEYGKAHASFIENVDFAIRQAVGNNEIEIDEEDRRQFVADLCAVLFIDDSDDPRRRDAYERGLAVPWGKPDTQRFRNLSF